MKAHLFEIDSPVQTLRYVVGDDRLVGVSFKGSWQKVQQHLNRHSNIDTFLKNGTGGPFADFFGRYFQGDLAALMEIPIRSFGTPFQKSVWKQLEKIKPGATASYGDIARRIKNPKAVRAVGLANGRNPVSLRVPCHRVVGSDGSLTGFGGGLSRKRWLLAHEQRHQQTPAP